MINGNQIVRSAIYIFCAAWQWDSAADVPFFKCEFGVDLSYRRRKWRFVSYGERDDTENIPVGELQNKDDTSSGCTKSYC